MTFKYNRERGFMLLFLVHSLHMAYVGLAGLLLLTVRGCGLLQAGTARRQCQEVP
jgi:hypothetical protein